VAALWRSTVTPGGFSTSTHPSWTTNGNSRPFSLSLPLSLPLPLSLSLCLSFPRLSQKQALVSLEERATYVPLPFLQNSLVFYFEFYTVYYILDIFF